MTARAMARRARADRLMGWTLMAAVCGFLLWIVFGGAALPRDRTGGNISSVAALEAVAEEEAARRRLQWLRGEIRP